METEINSDYWIKKVNDAVDFGEVVEPIREGVILQAIRIDKEAIVIELRMSLDDL